MALFVLGDRLGQRDGLLQRIEPGAVEMGDLTAALPGEDQERNYVRECVLAFKGGTIHGNELVGSELALPGRTLGRQQSFERVVVDVPPGRALGPIEERLDARESVVALGRDVIEPMEAVARSLRT